MSKTSSIFVLLLLGILTFSVYLHIENYSLKFERKSLEEEQKYLICV